MLCETSDGEFKLLRIRELTNDDVDGKPYSKVEDTPPNFSIGLRIVSGVKHWLHEIQVNVMQKSVVHRKWPNVVDIYCKRADAIKRMY